jgi:DNA-binding response OmpR family regulator
MNKTQILLVEDDKTLGATLDERLSKEGYIVYWVKNLQKAKEIFSSSKLDLIVLDVGLPDGSGFDFAKEIIKSQSPPPFLFLTALAGAQERLYGFELGAEEFIPKPFHLKELLLRITHVLKIHKREDENHLTSFQFHDFTIDFNSLEIRHLTLPVVQLSARDAGLLKLLILEKDRVISRDEILDKIWGEENFPTNRTIDNSIVRLRQSLGEYGSEAIKTIRSVGYRWVG